MNILILHSGNIGSTEKVAYKLSDTLGGAIVIDTAKCPSIDFKQFDVVVFGTNVRMSRFNKRFKKYAKRWIKTTNGSKAFVYIVGTAIKHAITYQNKVEKLFKGRAAAMFVGGELCEDKATGFSRSVIRSVKAELEKTGEPMPQIDDGAVISLATMIRACGRE